MSAQSDPLTLFRQARFLRGAARLSDCPDDTGAEVAFAGRSNAGKSSAINTLTDNRKLARTSKVPGRTQLINFFALGPDTRLVDLPGYGYARVPQATKERWHRHLDEYLRSRRSLKGIVLVMDIRHPLREFDQQMITWSASAGLPLHALLTKSDKLGQRAAGSALGQVKRHIVAVSARHSAQLFSATKKSGLAELGGKLETWLTSGRERGERP